jgi:hypothetical protein
LVALKTSNPPSAGILQPNVPVSAEKSTRTI